MRIASRFKMQFSTRDILVFPLLALATVPVCVAATAIGLIALPQFTTNWSETRDWFLNQGLPANFVLSELNFFWMGIPTMVVLALLALILFLIRTRICDQAAVVSLVALPFVDALQIGSLSDDFNVDSFGPNLGWKYLTTQSLTGVVLGVMIAGYVAAKWRIPNPVPTKSRTVVSTATLAVLFACSVAVWKYST